MAELNLFHYQPKNSFIHQMDARVKLFCMVLLSISLGISTKIFGLILLTIVLIIAFIGSRLPFKRLFYELRHFLWITGIVVVVHSFTVPGSPITGLPVTGLTWEGLYSGLSFSWRLLLILILCVILTGTTTLSQLKDSIEWTLRPIPFIPGTRVATMFALTFALVPQIFDQVSEIADAQKARCIERRKNPVRRISCLVPPLFLQIFHRADEMALAMESRCYSEARTVQTFKARRSDWLILFLSGSVCLVVFSSLLIH